MPPEQAKKSPTKEKTKPKTYNSPSTSHRPSCSPRTQSHKVLTPRALMDVPGLRPYGSPGTHQTSRWQRTAQLNWNADRLRTLLKYRLQSPGLRCRSEIPLHFNKFPRGAQEADAWATGSDSSVPWGFESLAPPCPGCVKFYSFICLCFRVLCFVLSCTTSASQGPRGIGGGARPSPAAISSGRDGRGGTHASERCESCVGGKRPRGRGSRSVHEKDPEGHKNFHINTGK